MSSNYLLSTLRRIYEKFPDELSGDDLIRMGIFKDHHCLYQCAKRHESFPRSKRGKNFLYDKERVLEWLLKNSYENHNNLCIAQKNKKNKTDIKYVPLAYTNENFEQIQFPFDQEKKIL